MTMLRFAEDHGSVEVARDEPYPVYVDGSTSTVGTRPLIRTFQGQIPGIGTGAAYANLDQFGTLLTFINVPTRGVIWDMRFFDLDNEGIDKLVWLFSETPALAADNAAFAVADVDIRRNVGVFQFSTWRAVGSTSQIGLTPNVPCRYDLGTENSNKLYVAVQTLGADNIAALNIPELAITIEAAL